MRNHQITAAALRSYKLRYGNELELQDDIERVLLKEYIDYFREFPLGSGRIDFLADHIGIECKVAGGVAEVMQQLVRYAGFAEVDGLILVTSRRTHRFAETTICGKPFEVIWVAGTI